LLETTTFEHGVGAFCNEITIATGPHVD
jgi:hypothetical protein